MVGVNLKHRKPPRSTPKRRIQAKYPLAVCRIQDNGIFIARLRIPNAVGGSTYTASFRTSDKAWAALEIMLQRDRLI